METTMAEIVLDSMLINTAQTVADNRIISEWAIGRCEGAIDLATFTGSLPREAADLLIEIVSNWHFHYLKNKAACMQGGES